MHDSVATDANPLFSSFAETKLAMQRAADLARRQLDDIALIAVSKQQTDEKITAALAMGHRLFGENRVQEAKERWASRRADFPDLRLHLIGPLQSNKAAEAVALFDVIEVIDRPKIAKAVAAELAKQNKSMSCLIQVNTGLEPQKSGIAPNEIADFIAFCKGEAGLPVDGLMCIPPADEEPAPHFALLAKYAKRHALPILSMGMSGDYGTAIQLGATHIRVGSALFGRRLPRAKD